jgi:hypothetical protein
MFAYEVSPNCVNANKKFVNVEVLGNLAKIGKFLWAWNFVV